MNLAWACRIRALTAPTLACWPSIVREKQRAHAGRCDPADDVAACADIRPERSRLDPPGLAADLLLFDPAKVQDKATFAEPHQYSEGFDVVIVNGKVAVEGGSTHGYARGKGDPASGMIQLTGAGKRFGHKLLFENLDWMITPKDRVGLVGANGTGKSTLLKVIGGMESLDYGIADGRQGRIRGLFAAGWPYAFGAHRVRRVHGCF